MKTAYGKIYDQLEKGHDLIRKYRDLEDLQYDIKAKEAKEIFKTWIHQICVPVFNASFEIIDLNNRVIDCYDDCFNWRGKLKKGSKLEILTKKIEDKEEEMNKWISKFDKLYEYFNQENDKCQKSRCSQKEKKHSLLIYKELQMAFRKAEDLCQEISLWAKKFTFIVMNYLSCKDDDDSLGDIRRSIDNLSFSVDLQNIRKRR